MARRHGRTRRGIALPTILFLIAILSVLAAGAITIVGSERRVLGNEGFSTQAFALARTGLDQFLLSRDSLGFTSVPPAPVESVRVMLSGGFADVVMERVREEGAGSVVSPAMYVVRSRGVLLDRSSRPRPIAERTLAQYARWQRPSMQVLAAHVALGGIVRSGVSGSTSGLDACGAASAVAGVGVPTTPGFTGGGGAGPVGVPPVLDLGTAAQTAQAIALDWDGIVSQGIAAATVQLPGGLWPNGAQWGDPTFWPVILVTGDFTVPTDGRGLLVVTGNLTMPSLRTWQGIVLAGGTLQVSAGATVSGALVTGLNAKLGVAVGSDQVAGDFVSQYDSCLVARALSAFDGLSALRNATTDRWAY